MRTLFKSEAFERFYASLEPQAKTKMDYALTLLAQMKIVSTKFVKKIKGTDFYELRVSTSNEYRILALCLDNDNIIEAGQVVLLNGFLKKATKDYQAQIKKAQRIVKELSDDKD